MLKMKFEGFYKPYIKINSKWIKYLNIIPDTIKLLEEKLGSILFNINYSSNFCGPISLSNGMKNKIKYMGYKFKKALHSKGNHKQSEKTTHRVG